MRSGSRFPQIVMLVAALALGSSFAGSTPAASDTVADEVAVEEIARMLDEGVPSDVVREWLSSRSTRVSSPDPDAMIRLRRAGADQALLKLIIERSSSAVPVAPSAAAAVAAADGGLARVDVTLVYRPFEELEGDDRAPSPDLALYVDGRAFARVSAQADIGHAPITFRMHVPPGPHVVRLAREFADGPAREDPATIAPESLAIDVEPDVRFELEIRWVDGAMSFGAPHPLTWSLRRDGELRSGAEKIGTATDRWPELCDDIEATLDPEKTPGRPLRQRLEACIRWADLFPGVDDLPSRETARAAAREGGRGGFENTTPFSD